MKYNKWTLGKQGKYYEISFRTTFDAEKGQFNWITVLFSSGESVDDFGKLNLSKFKSFKRLTR